MTLGSHNEDALAQSLIEDYLKRALLRRDILQFFYQKQSYADVVRDSRAIVDLTMMAAMFSANISLSKEAVSQERLATEDVRNIVGISSLLEKERHLADAIPGSILPSRYFTEEDARLAIHMTDRTLSIFVPQLAPKLSHQLENPSSRPAQGPGPH